MVASAINLLCCLLPTNYAMMQVLPLSTSYEGTGKQQFRAEVHGLMPPWGVDLICKAIRESGAGDCQVTAIRIGLLLLRKPTMSDCLGQSRLRWIFCNLPCTRSP
jgi:hypothetical protein